jgi:hypothetical protein
MACQPHAFLEEETTMKIKTNIRAGMISIGVRLPKLPGRGAGSTCGRAIA